MGGRGVVGGALAIALAACGFTAIGDLPANDGAGPSSTSGGPGGAGGPGVGGTDGGTSVSFVSCDSGLVDPGLVILPPDGGGCPTGTTEHIAETDPVALAGACSCATCTPTAEPTCAGNNFTWRWGPDNGCNSGPADYDVTADNAFVIIYPTGPLVQIDVYNRWNRTPQPGSCTASGVGVPGKLATTTVRQCVPNANADVCAAVTSGQRLCVPSDLDGGACTGMYSTRIVVGDGANLTCAACACARTATACDVEYHDNETCTSKVYERLADNTCIMTGRPSIRAIKVYPKNVACTTTPGTASASLSNARALCCTP